MSLPLLHRIVSRSRMMLAAALLLPGAGSPSDAPASAAQAGEGWIDESREQLSQGADSIALWVDDFFGHPREVEDQARSRILIRPQVEWDEQDGWDWKLRATGRLDLPKTSDRLSVVFSGGDGNFDDDLYDPSIASGGDSAAGVQYQIRRQKRSTAYLFAGVKSGPKLKLGARYRFLGDLNEHLYYRFSEEVFWVGGDGFTSRTRLDFNRPLSQNTLLRWANRVDHGEETNGAEWRTRLAWIRRLDKRNALRVFGFVRGDSDPEILKSRGIGVGYRRRFLRDWLFLEIEPRYAWRKRKQEQDREGVAMVKLRFEVVIGER